MASTDDDRIDLFVHADFLMRRHIFRIAHHRDAECAEI
jgi:hypothetical protein